MKSILLSTLIALAVLSIGLDRIACGRIRSQGSKTPAPTWHEGYYEPEWGMPLALVVPPKAEMQVHYGWGVGETRTTPINYQYHRDNPIPGYYNRAGFQPVPYWPNSTDQMGVYYIRGPW